MQTPYDQRFPSIQDLRERARKRIPRFAFEYLDGGCNEDVNLHRNRSDLQAVELVPRYISDHGGACTKTILFGFEYSAPFGIAPIGLQGLVWPKATEILASAAHKENIPFILSAVATASIERVAELTQGTAWFQLYHPARREVRDDLLRRAASVGCPVLVILADVPTFGFRPRDIRNGLGMPPKMSLKNVLQILGRPRWALNTLLAGQPRFATLEKYMPRNLSLVGLSQFMNQTFSGRLSRDRIAELRDLWPGKLVIKGIASEEDAELAVQLGLDGMILSNHGGRQLDAGQSTIATLPDLAEKFGHKITVMMDSGIRSGPDIARTLARGAKFTFLGRSFMYGVAALGEQGGNHTIGLLKSELKQVMDQICCATIDQLPSHLFTSLKPAIGRGLGGQSRVKLQKTL